MIIKVVQKESIVGEYFHDYFVEADRIEIQFVKEFDSNDSGLDWYYTDDVLDNSNCGVGRSVYIVRCWKAWPTEKYEYGAVSSGRIYLINDSGKTIDKYVI